MTRSRRETWPLAAVLAQAGMEHLWSQVGATGRTPSQTHPPRKRLTSPDRQTVSTPRNNEIFDGKEGVDGSSPSEGLYKCPANGHVALPAVARFGHLAGTRRVHFGTGGHSWASATSRGLRDGVREKLDRNHRVEKFRRRGPNARAPRTPGSRCAYTASSGADVGHRLGGAQELEEIRLRC
jgi:hypothetical protein